MEQLFDQEKAMAQVGGSEDLLRELVDIFRHECPDLLKQMRTAIDQPCPADLQRAAHTLKGSARVLGAEPLAESAFRLEQMGQANQMTEAPQALEAVQAEADRLMVTLNTWTGHVPTDTSG